MWEEIQGGGSGCGCGWVYLVGLLNALDTAHEPHSQEYSLLGTGPGSLESMPTQSADEWGNRHLMLLGPKTCRG